MTAVASEAGTIDASIAGKDINNAMESMDDLEVVESNVTMEDRRDSAQLRFKYGRNTTDEIERGAKGVEKATRKVPSVRRPIKAVRVSNPTTSKRPISPHGGTKTGIYTAKADAKGKRKVLNRLSEPLLPVPVPATPSPRTLKRKMNHKYKRTTQNRRPLNTTLQP
jgi:hypothetical protein